MRDWPLVYLILACIAFILATVLACAGTAGRKELVMGCLSDYCQCCRARLGGLTSYRCDTCDDKGYCQEIGCGKCDLHCPHKVNQ